MTIRLADDQAEELELIARVLEAPLAEVIRQAVTNYIAGTRASVEFKSRLSERFEADQEIVSRYIYVPIEE